MQHGSIFFLNSIIICSWKTKQNRTQRLTFGDVWFQYLSCYGVQYLYGEIAVRIIAIPVIGGIVSMLMAYLTWLIYKEFGKHHLTPFLIKQRKKYSGNSNLIAFFGKIDLLSEQDGKSSN
jgi:hypothetical protein